MPPTAPYLLALFLYVFVAFAVWFGCAVLALFPSGRNKAWRTALSMLASFPGVLLCQAIAFPFCLLLFGAAAGLFYVFGPRGDTETVLAPLIFIPATVCVVTFFASASLYGAWLGWDITWRVTGGTTLAEAFRAHCRLHGIVRLFGAWFRRVFEHAQSKET